MFDRVPDDVGVQGEVRVSDEIPQAGDLSPGHVRVAFAQFTREFLDRFTDDMGFKSTASALTSSPNTWSFERPSA